MEEYKRFLYRQITKHGSDTIEDVEKIIIDKRSYIINRNEEGKIHSKYLGDRYEPAIIELMGIKYYLYYYLFDGDIEDCEHPFCIAYAGGIIEYVIYYSSERIKNGLPIYLGRHTIIYNLFCAKTILDEYEINCECKNGLEDFTELCDEMNEPTKFKFAD